MPATPATNNPVGKVFVLHGTVKAISAEGVERVLALNSPIFANDQIITEGDGSVSVVFNDPTLPQLNLGRMTEMTIDEEVYGGDTGVGPADAAAEVQEVQTALAAGEVDPNTLPAPAAGDPGPATDGGGHPTVKFELTAEELTPDSGAETTGVGLNFLDPPPADILGANEPPLPTLSINDSVDWEPTGTTQTIATGEIVALGDGYASVDHWYFHHDGGDLTIDLLSDRVFGDPGAADELDTYIYLFKDDGSLDTGDYVAHNDDGGSAGHADGSTHNWDSFLDLSDLEAGNYVLAVSDYRLTDIEATTSINDASTLGVDTGSYQITLTGSAQFTTIPGGGEIVSETGATLAEFTVTLSEISDVDVSVDFTTADGTAIAGGSGVAEDDYGATAGTVIIPAGSLTATLVVSIYGDNVPDGGEQYYVNLSNAVNATIADGQGVGTILDTYDSLDHQPLIEAGDSSVDETGGLDSDQGDLAFSYGLDGPGTFALSADNDPGATWSFDVGTGVGTLAASDGSYKITVDQSSGMYTFEQLSEMSHPDSNDHNDVINLGFTATVTDVDGDSKSAAFTVSVYDDGPVFNGNTFLEYEGDNQSPVSQGEIDESGGIGQTLEGDLGFSYGQDGPGDLELSASIGGSEVSSSWSVDANTGIGTLLADDGTFKIEVDQETGEYVFTQLAAMDHPDATDHNDSIDLDFTAAVTDADGDTTTGGFTITVYDDGPSLSVEHFTQANETGVTGYSGTIDTSFGADGPADADAIQFFSENGQLLNVDITDDNGDGVYDFNLLVSDNYSNLSDTTGGPGDMFNTVTIAGVDGDFDMAEENIQLFVGALAPEVV